jgi:peptide chain release factor subunit 1
MVSRCLRARTGRIFDTKGNQVSESRCVAIEPPRKILQRYYRCDRRFHTEQLQESSTPSVKFGLVWCNGDDVDLYDFFTNYELKNLKSCSAHLKNSHRKGGQSQKRFERLIEGQRNDYYNYIVEIIHSNFTLETENCIQKLFIVGNSNKQSEIFKRMSIRFQSCCELITSDGSSIYDVLKTLNLNINRQTEKYIGEFYSQLHLGMITYGRKETKTCLESGQLRVMFSMSRDDEPLCKQWNTEFVLIEGKTSLEQKFINEFGGIGGITRWKVDEFVTE